MTRKEILNRAAECVTGKRHEDYGTPEDNFTLIARLWTDYCGFGFSAVDVSMMMALLKIARIARGGTDDCFVDLAGYAACGGEIYSTERDLAEDGFHAIPNDVKEEFMKGMLPQEEIDSLLKDTEDVMTPRDIAKLIAQAGESDDEPDDSEYYFFTGKTEEDK